MTIPYLKGWGDTLAENGGQIGSNISHIINPNIDYQNMLKAAIAKDPTILQQIANNPGLAQSIQQMGLSKNIAQQTSSLGVDPGVQSQRDFNRAKADVAQGTVQSDISTAASTAREAGDKADVAHQTKGAVIRRTNNDADLSDIDLKNAKMGMQDAQSAFDKYPDLKDINMQQLAQGVVSGNPDPTQLARISQNKGAQSALDVMVKSINDAKDRVEHLSIAQLTHHTATLQDKQFNISLLKGLSDSLSKQIVDANTYLKSLGNTAFLMQGPEPAKPTDKDMNSPAWQQYNKTMGDRQQYQQAKEIAGPNSIYFKRLAQVNNKMAVLSNLDPTLFQDPESAPGNPTPGGKKATALTSDQISTLAQNDNITDAVLNKNIADGTITAQDAQKVRDSRKKATTPTPATNPTKTGFKYRGLVD